MAKVRAAVIGCGRRNDEQRIGCGVSTNHGKAYAGLDGVETVAFCDLVSTRAEAFRDEHGTGEERIYTDCREMLDQEKPDIVSVCTWPKDHPKLVIACAEAGVPAVHCEKPMALTWGAAKRMAEACRRGGTQLTFNHQRRFNPPFRKVRELLADGEVGELLRIESYTGNLYDWGTHWFDMTFFFNGDVPAEWVMGQVDVRTSHTVFGAPLEHQGLSFFRFTNGVYAMMCTGQDAPRNVAFRLIGTEGVIELGGSGGAGLRIMGKGHKGWKQLDKEPQLHGAEPFALAIADAVDALQNKREPELAARKALQSTEVLFATYESARRGNRVDLPLDVDDSPIAALIAGGGR